MDLDTIKRHIQDFFQNGTVTVVGSGLSLSEGIPGMGALAMQLSGKLPSMLTTSSDKSLWSEIDKHLSSGLGLEEALHLTKPNSNIEECIRKTTAEYIGEAEKKIFEEMITRGKSLRFSEYLHRFNIKSEGLTVITTNYDRLIEYACESQNLCIDTLFIGKNFSRFSPEQSKYFYCNGMNKRNGKLVATFAPKVTILKPHGCLSWHMINGEPYSIPNYQANDCLIITPGLNKYREGYSVPFDTHRTKANIAIDSAQRYVIIGYGFGDSHLETHLMQQLNYGKPALILTHSLSAKATDVVKNCKNITAICHANISDTQVLTATENIVFPDINMWDIREMIKEVF